MATVGEPLWITFDSAQSRSLLVKRDFKFVRFTAPRDFLSVILNLVTALWLFRRHNVTEVISTGSGIALSFLPLARLRGIRTHYIESAARSEGPSMTGKIVARIPGIHLYTQYESWSSDRWLCRGSVFDEFRTGEDERAISDEGRLKVLISLGTLDYRFDRMVEAVRAALMPSWDVVWQVGPNDYGALPGKVHDLVSSHQLDELNASADVVISHAGVGAALTAFGSGKHAILVPRERTFGEHIDDHQRLVADELSERGLASVSAPDQISTESILAAARRTVCRSGSNGPTFVLQG